MISKLNWYVVECDCCHIIKEVSTIFTIDDDTFRIRMADNYGWTIIKETILTPRGYFAEWRYHTYCNNDVCKLMLEQYKQYMKEQENEQENNK